MYAARCESGAKHFGVFTMVSETTHDAAVEHGEDDLCFRRLNRVNVVGREQAVMLYELMGSTDQVSDRDLECCSLYEAALECHFKRDWATAEAKLTQSLELERHPGSNPSQTLLSQVLKLKDQPPSDDWDGVLQLDSK